MTGEAVGLSGRRRAVAVAVAAVATAAACGRGGDERRGGTGAAAARAVTAALEATADLRAPWRCALARDPGPAPAGWRLDGGRLVAVEPRARVTVAAVAQARGAAVDLRADLRAAGVDVVVTTGGMGEGEGDSRAALEALLDPAWLVVAVPGDAEDWPAHARAVAALAAAGGAIVDGASARIIDGGGAVLATLPGERWAGRLQAGSEGCTHDDADLAATLEALAAAAGDRPRVLVTTPAPQGGASDLAPGGVHAGEPGLARAVADARLDLVVHGPVDAAVLPQGAARRGTSLALAAGLLDPVPRRALDGQARPRGAVVATVDARGVTWRLVPAP